MLPEPSKVNVFSKVNLKEGFLQVESNEDNSKLSIFQAPWRR